MPKGIKMAEVTWVEILEAFAKNWPVVIPLGAACKEHGLHLPMNTDFLQAEYWANYIAENYEVVVSPTISDSYYPAFKAYAGSSSLSPETSCDYFVQKCAGWYEQGAQKFYVVNMGISTNKPLQAAKIILNKKGIPFEYLDLTFLDKDKRITDIMQQKLGTHADEIETSIMLYIHPEKVHIEKARPEENDGPGPLSPNPLADPEKYTISLTGAWGNPTLATADKGKIAIEVIKEKIATELAILDFGPSKVFTSPGL
jgi:creatinine amidohydrolase